MSLQLPFGVTVLNPAPLDTYYFNSGGTPYSSTAQVISQVPLSVRYQGQTFNVNGVEYWFGTGTADGNLAVKSSLIFSNGLTNTSGTVTLGGTLSSNSANLVLSSGTFYGFYVKSGDGHSFFGVNDQDNNEITFNAIAKDHTNLNIYSQLYNNKTNAIIQHSVNGNTDFSRMTVDGTINIEVQSTGGTKYSQVLINGNSGTISLVGSSPFWGAAADYSASYTSRSFTDKNYVDTHLTGLTFSNSPSSGQVAQYNGTNFTWVTVGSGGTITGLTATRIPYAATATSLADDSHLNWDNTNKRLGVGTVSPSRNIHSFFTDGTNTNTVGYASKITKAVSSGSPVAGIGVGLEMETQVSTGPGYIVGSTIESVTTGVTSGQEAFDLVFKTAYFGSASLSEGMRLIASGGNNDATILSVGRPSSTNSSQIQSTNAGLNVKSQSGYPIQFSIGSTIPMIIQSGGQVSIGVNSSARQLYVYASDGTLSSVTYPIRATHATTGGPSIGVGVGLEFETQTSGTPTLKVGNTIESVSTNITGGTEAFDLVFKSMSGGSLSETMRLTSSGFLGIGVSPSSKLHIKLGSSTTNSILEVERITRTTTGTPASGIGASTQYEIQGQAGNIISTAIQSYLTTVTSGNEDSAIDFATLGGGALITRATVDKVGFITYKYRLFALNTAPSSSSDTGTTGEIRWVNGFVYLCVATNTWQRATLSTF